MRSDGLKFEQEAAVAADAIVDPGEPERIPDAGLRRRHHGDAELAFQRLDRTDHRPVRRGEKDRIRLRMSAHQLAAQLERGADRNAAELVDRLAKAERSESLAAVTFGIGDEPRIFLRTVGMRDHGLPATERLRRLLLRGDAGGDLDAEL